MTEPTAPFRCATSDDAAQMAELVNIAGAGLPLYLWAKFARPGQTPGDVGLERARLGLGGFAHHNTVVFEVDGQIVAGMISHPLGDSPQPPGLEATTVLAPLEELQDMVRGTWYINILATYPQHRGKGFATKLLRIAESRANDSQNKRVSLIVSDANIGAQRLYARNGYAVLATRPIVKEGWSHSGQNWMLLVKDL